MLKLARLQILSVAALLGVVMASAKAPHVQLLIGVLSGQRNYRAIPVHEFTAAAFREPTLRLPDTFGAGEAAISTRARSMNSFPER